MIVACNSNSQLQFDCKATLAVRDRRAATATWAATAASSPRELVHAPLLGSEAQKEAGAKAGGGGQARLEHLLQPLRAVLKLL